MTQLFSFLEFATILADSGFSAKILFFIFGINKKYLFLFEKFRFTFEFSWVEWYTFQQKSGENAKLLFWRFWTSPDFPWRFVCPKTPEMNVSDPYLVRGKNPGTFFCLTVEKSSMEVGDPSPSRPYRLCNLWKLPKCIYSIRVIDSKPWCGEY